MSQRFVISSISPDYASIRVGNCRCRPGGLPSRDSNDKMIRLGAVLQRRYTTRRNKIECGLTGAPVDFHTVTREGVSQGIDRLAALWTPLQTFQESHC